MTGPEPSGEQPVRLTAWVHGRVQGVGMRWWIRSRALEAGLVGWARNLPDGRVEVVVEGSEPACGSLLAQLAPAPPRVHDPARPGRIDTVVERWSAASGLDVSLNGGFQQR